MVFQLARRALLAPLLAVFAAPAGAQTATCPDPTRIEAASTRARHVDSASSPRAAPAEAAGSRGASTGRPTVARRASGARARRASGARIG